MSHPSAPPRARRSPLGRVGLTVLTAAALLASWSSSPFPTMAAAATPVVVGGAVPLTPVQQTRAVTQAIAHHSFTPPLLRNYYGEGEIPHWTLTGSTVITDHYVRLTPEASSATGHLWNTEPLDMDAFEIVIGYRVFKQTPGASADGFALWITTEPPRVDGPIFGHPMSFVGLGVLFDTYDNDNMKDNPLVSVITNSPGERDRKYSPERDFRTEFRGSCIFDYRNIPSPRLATARIRYNQGTLQVSLSKNNEDAEKACFTVHRVELPTDKTPYYIGFTANTGGVTANHDIVFMHLMPLDGHEYGHDVHETKVPQGAPEHRGAFHNYDRAQEGNDQPQQQQQQQPPQQQQPTQEQQQQQQQHEGNQNPPPPPPPPQEQQQQQHQPPPPPPQQQHEQQQQQQQYQQPPPPPPQQQQHEGNQYPPQHDQQQQQQQQQYQQPPPPPPPQQQQQQQQQYQQPPPPPPPQQQQHQQQQQQAAMDDKARLEMLERELAALRNRQQPPPRRDGGDDWVDDEEGDEYYDEGRGGGRRRRARTNRRRNDY